MSLPPPHRTAGSRRGRRPSRGRTILKRVLVVLFSFALVIGGIGVGVYKHLEGNINGIDVNGSIGKDRPQRVLVAGNQQPLNVLVMGSDTRKGQGPAIKGQTPGLSDTTILLHVSADRTRAYGVSIPRDTMVERPGCKTKAGGNDPGGLTQFNAAYAIGGPACTIKTVEKITGVFVDHFVVVNFNGFRKMVNALGGIKICVPSEVNDTTGNIHLAAGTYKVTGEQALDYVRVRHGISANGDIGRMKRQQTFIAAMISKAVSAGTLANPVRLLSFLNAATSSLTTDTGFARLRALADLGSSLKGIGLDNVQFVTAPSEPYPPDVNRLQLSPEATGLWKQIKDDQSMGQAYTTQVVTAADSTPGASKVTTAMPSRGVRRDLASVRAGTYTLSQSTTQTADQKAQTAAENGLCT